MCVLVKPRQVEKLKQTQPVYKEDNKGTDESSPTFKVLDNKFLRSTGFTVGEGGGARRLGQSVRMMPNTSSQEHISRL